jgi:hypothetical protein
VPWSSSNCSSSSSSSSTALLSCQQHDLAIAFDHQQQQQSDLQSELDLLSLGLQSSLLNETAEGVMTLDGFPLPKNSGSGCAADVAARLAALLEGLNDNTAESACSSSLPATPPAVMSNKHPSDIFSGVASFSIIINSHISSSSSSSMQMSDQPGNAAAATKGNVLHCRQLCYQMAWHDVAQGLPESASDASAVVVGGAPIKQQQHRRKEASVQACVSGFCPSVVATVSNQELQQLLLALDRKEQAARLMDESSNNSESSSDVQRDSFMGLSGLTATPNSAALCQLSYACAAAAPAAAPAAAGLMLLFDWEPADW